MDGQIPNAEKERRAARAGAAERALRQRYRIPILGVIDPAAEAAAAATRTGHIGVLGTQATIRSGAYEAAIRAQNGALRVSGIACPLFVPLIENGFDAFDPITQLTIERYLQPIAQTDIDTLILGCTHYPFLAEAIAAYLPKVQLLNIGTALARALPQQIALQNGEKTRVSYCVSDPDTGFQTIANRHLDAIRAEHIRTVSIESY